MTEAWFPPTHIRDHAGNSIASGVIFLAPPPAEIRKLLSAHSSLSVDRITELQNQSSLRRFFRSPRSTGQCTYVGTEGLAVQSLGVDGRSSTARQLVFFDADVLWTYEIHKHVNGQYQGTSAYFGWADYRRSKGGTILFEINGSYYGKDRVPESATGMFFGRAAENAWSKYYLARSYAAIQNSNVVEYMVREDSTKIVPKGTIRLTSKEIQIELPGLFGHSSHNNWRDIQRVSVEVGSIVLKLTNGKVLTRVSYSHMANAQAFVSLASLLISLSQTSEAGVVTI